MVEQQDSAALSAETTSLETRDGLKLQAWRYRPAPTQGWARGRVLLVHGYGEHQGRYSHVVAALTADGYECSLFDLRGHGASGGPRGHVSDFEAYRDDLGRVTAWAWQERDLPTVVVAHSLGGLIALSALIHRQLGCDALVLSSPFLAPAFGLSSIAELGLKLGGRILPRLTFPAGVEADGLSRDPAVVEAYLEDPRIVRKITLAWGLAVLRAQQEVFERATEVVVPTLFLLGGADPIADPARGQEIFDRLGSPKKDLRIYDDYRHEVFNEVGRERVLADLVAWLNGNISSPV